MEIVTLDRLITGLLACGILVVIAYRRGGRALTARTGKEITSSKMRSR
jgi:hypothetical protein